MCYNLYVVILLNRYKVNDILVSVGGYEMDNLKLCPVCGTENGESNRFCTNCGELFDKNAKKKNELRYKIKGENLPYVEITLSKGEKIVCEGGSMSWKSDSVKMNTSTNGGIGKVFSRMFTGERLFQNIYTAEEDNSIIAFSSSFPGAIMAIDVAPGKEVICQKSSFLAGTAGIEVSIYFNKRIGVGLFAGEGFIMQKMTGTGKVFIEIDGSMEERYLKEGEKLVISTGHLVMIDSTCKIDIETVKGLKNIILGGEGLFNTIVTGPGKVVLQSMPISKTANTLYPYMPKSNVQEKPSVVSNLIEKE